MSGEPELQPERRRLVGDRYELETLIGKGGVGEVWRARHVALNSPVAIKFLQGTSAQKDSVRRRFTTEAQITAQLRTANAVQVFDFGITDEGHPYLVMELLEGETLGQRLERLKRLPATEVVRLLGQCARALQRAHQLGIVHRDFKPENVVICVDDQGHEQVKVLDFGIAKLVGALEQTGERDSATLPGTSSTASTFSSFTRTGSVLGTPLYMAPEQVTDPADVDLRADIWAFGVVAYQCLTGRVPFTAESLEVLFERIRGGLHTRAGFIDEALPPAFDDWFDVACSPHPEKRFGSAIVAFRQLASALGVVAKDDSNPAPSRNSPLPADERRILVVPNVSSSATAAGPGSIGRIGLRTTDRPPPPPPPGPAVPLAAYRTLDAPAPSSSRRVWIAGGVAVCLIAGVGIWMGSTRSDAPSAVPSAVPSVVAQPSAPVASSGEASAQPLPAAAPSASAAAHDLPPTPSVAPAPTPRRPPPRAASSAARAPTEPTVAPVAAATAPPPATTSPPAPPPPPADPGSYR